jgi:hypothetical protein
LKGSKFIDFPCYSSGLGLGQWSVSGYPWLLAEQYITGGRCNAPPSAFYIIVDFVSACLFPVML